MEENNVKLLIFLEVKKHLQARKGKIRSRGTNSRFAVCRKHDSKSLYSLLDWTKEVRSSRKSSLGRSGGGAGKGRRACNYVAQYLNFCIGKCRCELLIGRDDISNDVITLDTWILMLAFIRARFRFALIGGNLTAQSTRSHRGLGITETWLQALLRFPAPPPERPGELARSRKRVGLVIWRSRSSPALKTHWICQYYPVPGSEIVGSVNINWKSSNTKIKRDESPFFPPPSSFLRLRAHVFVCLSLTSSLPPESLEQANII